MASDEPRGDFAMDADAARRLSKAFVISAILFALTFITLGVIQIEPSAWWEWALVVGPFVLAVSPLFVIAASGLGRLRGNPAIVLSDEGLEVQRGGLWTVLPFLVVPERQVIPWTRIRDIHEHYLGVIVDHEDYRPSLIRRVLGLISPDGEVISVPRLEEGDRDPYELLLGWNESRLVDSVRGDRLESPPNEKVT